MEDFKNLCLAFFFLSAAAWVAAMTWGAWRDRGAFRELVAIRRRELEILEQERRRGEEWKDDEEGS